MNLTFQICDSISKIGESLWEQFRTDDYPFTRYAFLHALESSGAVCAETGWQPAHLKILVDGAPVAVLPMYLKSHSYGEYVFDWAWADAYQRHGRPYYPKLVTSIPFSPVTGPRLLTPLSTDLLLPQLTIAIPKIAATLGAYSWHGLFFSAAEIKQFGNAFLLRQDCQYHWYNRNYQNFEHYLAHFNSRKRKNLRKERQKISHQGVQLTRSTGTDISPDSIRIFYRFYQATYWKRGQRPYLPPEFFHQLRETMPEQLLLVEACCDDQPVAAALCLQDSQTLYGRYWGCLEEFDSLHFETCYYQGIDHCIETGRQRFDPGAQGEHKIQRGFEPTTTYSAHWLQEQGFNEAIARFILEEQHVLDERMQALAQLLPFKQATESNE
ncbi:GNAT family N-acetyltransferase [Pontibacter sp. JAM-7]|uniref:GNAT family N-acetyltransferase n=1 Tax=Pontibacter sp. JAM-7 TaxID=3366581 RepID=UPI003AF59F42